MRHSNFFSIIISFVTIFTGNVTTAMDKQHSRYLDILQNQVQLANESAVRAISCNSPKLLEAAINNGANRNCIDDNGNNWLLIAIDKNKRNILNMFLDEPMFHTSEFINHQNNTGETALMKVCFLGDFMTVSKLICLAKTIINQQDFNGYTAAHYAAQSDCFRNRADIIKQLVTYGADFTIQDKTGITPVIFLAPHAQELSPETLEKIISQRDVHKNTQLHLLAKAKPNALHYKSDYDLFEQVTLLSKTVGLGVFNLNLYGELPIEHAMQKYEHLKASSASDRDITACENKLHQLLRFYLTQATTSPILTTSCMTNELNVETEIALTDSTQDQYYYDRPIDYKNKTKDLIKRKPHIITWTFDPNHR